MTTRPATRDIRSSDRATRPRGPGPSAVDAASSATTRAGVALNDAQRERLADLSRGPDPGRAGRARMLLLAEKGYNDGEVAGAVGVHRVTVWRLRKRVAERGLEAALARPHRKKLDEDRREYLLALSRSEPPKGRTRWTPRLLADELVARGLVESISHVAVWHALKNAPRRG